MIRPAALALVCMAALVAPAAFAASLALPEGAVRTALRDGGAVAAGPATPDGVPRVAQGGHTTTEAWRIPGDASSEAILALLAAQLGDAGWQTVFACETRACGGFEFRYGLPVTPEPDMHVSLGDFRYLSARDDDRAIGVLISRSADAAHVEITRITRPDAAAAGVATPTTEVVGDPPAQPTPQAPFDPDGLIARLVAAGHVALDDLEFATGAATLTDTGFGSLAALAEFLAANPEARLTLVGHTDSEGGLAGNIALSKRRAEAVASVLVSRFGADRRRIAAEGAGWLAPRASNATPEGRQLNRRVEAVLN